MTFFDFVVIVLVGASVVAGALRGLVRAALVGAALIIGVIVAAQIYKPVGCFMRGVELVGSVEAANAAGFLLVVGVALIAGFAAGRLVRGGLRRARLEWFDHLLGGVFGFVRGSGLLLGRLSRVDSFSRATSIPLPKRAPLPFLPQAREF